MLEAWKAQRKQQIVYEIYKIASRMHTLIFADGALGRKTHRTAARSNILKRAWSEKVAIGTAKRAKRANQMAKNALIEAVRGSKKGIFNQTCLKSFCKIVLPAEAGSMVLKNVIRKVS